jgi:hypothetical protein
VPLPHLPKEAGVLESRHRVVDGTRAGDDGQPPVGPANDVGHSPATGARGGGRRPCERQDRRDGLRGDDDVQTDDAGVRQAGEVDRLRVLVAELLPHLGQQLRVRRVDLLVHPAL